ncbi:universal stress protein [Candidatus Nitrosotenuis sp. DW1]|uniref:universal stress protein n=1 Tax=Candidatus Nitrosotenuis sp. DW1 TaxID=2259672 RepID=UPI0015CD03A8|nr:universal stress protein [Candidatus Nitrosotenuis sp. DW1]QLH09516.1 universal stress protein [Candidatus Nitrosotenuis sp. DW1]
MGWFNKILVPIDGSRQSFKALDSAIRLAQDSGAELTLFHAIPHIDAGGPRTKTLDNQIVTQGNDILKKATMYARKKKIQVKTKTARGSPAFATIKFAKSGNFDHIVMSTTGAGSAEGEMLGSVSNYILHKSKIPVYLVK